MSYIPKTEEQLAEEACAPEGVYDFEVIDTSDKQSKTGKDMITLSLHVFTGESPLSLRDWIVLGNNFGERKLRHAADACNLLPQYESGKLTHADFKGATGKLYLKIQQGNEDYPLPKNAVADDVKRGPKDAAKAAVAAVESDDIPFVWIAPLVAGALGYINYFVA